MHPFLPSFTNYLFNTYLMCHAPLHVLGFGDNAWMKTLLSECCHSDQKTDGERGNAWTKERMKKWDVSDSKKSHEDSKMEKQEES